jgi:hypothetical protein
MFRRALLASLLLITWACTTQQTARQPSTADANASPLVFLTRGGCVNTDTMRERLNDALKSMGSALRYALVDLDTLAETDPRRGYPTPTLLYENRDVFGLPEPKPPIPEPT